MKQFDGGFDFLYEMYATDPGTARGGAHPEDTYQNVLRKAGLVPQQRRKPVFKTALAAAAVATAAILAAAAAYSAGDAFRGVVEVHDSAQATSQSEAVMDRTGMVINDTENSGTVEFSLRAAVADEHTLRVLVEVADSTGNGLAIRQPDGSLSDGYFALEEFSIADANGEPLSGSAGYEFLYTDAARSRFTILFTYHLTDHAVGGENLKLHFADILQYADRQGTTLKMEPDALYQIVAQFGEYGEDDFRLSDRGEDGLRYQLNVADSAISLPFSEDAPSVRITAATVRDGALYFQGTGDEDQLDRILENVVLVRGGDRVQATAMGRNYNAWTLRFDGVQSLEDLKGVAWHYAGGENYHVAYKGQWDFAFRADVEDMAIRLEPNAQTNWDGYDLTVTQLEISPYTLLLGYSVDEETALRMFPKAEWGTMVSSHWLDSAHTITITMKDGSTVKAEEGGMSFRSVDWMTPMVTEYEMLYPIDAVIDPSQIVSVQIGDQIIAVGQ